MYFIGGSFLAVYADMVRLDTNRTGRLIIFNVTAQTINYKNSDPIRIWASLIMFDSKTNFLIGGCESKSFKLLSFTRSIDSQGNMTQAFNLTTPRLIPTCLVIDSQRIFVTGGFQNWSK